MTITRDDNGRRIYCSGLRLLMVHLNVQCSSGLYFIYVTESHDFSRVHVVINDSLYKINKDDMVIIDHDSKLKLIVEVGNLPR